MYNLKEYRLASNRTLANTAKLLGLPNTTYHQYERGQRRPPIPVLLMLAKLYRTTIDALVAEDPETPTDAA